MTLRSRVEEVEVAIDKLLDELPCNAAPHLENHPLVATLRDYVDDHYHDDEYAFLRDLQAYLTSVSTHTNGSVDGGAEEEKNGRRRAARIVLQSLRL